MSDPARKFIMKVEEPLRNAHAGAYALVMAAQVIHDDSEREAISLVARGVVRVLDEILVEATGHSEPTPTRPVESTPPGPVAPTPPRPVTAMREGKAAMPAGGTPAKPLQSAKLPKIEIAASSVLLEERIGADPIRAEILPFRIGRHDDDGERASTIPPDLAIEDPKPHRLSRSHFEIITEDGKICVRDLHSALGTSVNGRLIGKKFTTDVAALEIGRNLVAAGGRDTPYEFAVTID